MSTPRIYVADLAAYNAGTLHGQWIDATLEVDDIFEVIHEMLRSSPEPGAEEFAIHDYEYFYGYEVDEYESIEEVQRIATFLDEAEHPELAAALLGDFNIDDAAEMLNDRYRGCYESLEEFAREMTTETVPVPEALADYIDYERMGSDYEASGDFLIYKTTPREVHILWSR